jgi:hypothetical protein
MSEVKRLISSDVTGRRNARRAKLDTIRRAHDAS